MTEPGSSAEEPPLVLKQADGAPPVAAPEVRLGGAPRRPGPGFWEAVIWSALFVMGQLFGALVAVLVAFGIHMLAAANPGQFVDEQLGGLTRALDPNVEGERPAVPSALGEALAWGMVAAQFFSLAMILVVCPRRIGPDWKRQLGMRRPSAFHVVLILMVIPGFMITADAIQTLFVWATGLKPPFAVRALNGIFGKFPWPLTAIAVALGPGIVEELWCRGFLGRGLSARYGLGLGVFITSMLFAGMHLDPSQFLVIAAMGAYLHFTYLATRSIWVPILLHASNNGLAIVLALAIKPAENEIKVIPIIVYLVALGLVVFASVALWTSRAVLLPVRSAGAKEERDEWAPSWHPEYPGISAPPAGSGLVVGAEPVSPVAVIFTFACFGILLYLTYRFVL